MILLLTGHKGQLGRLLKPALASFGQLVTIDREETDLYDLDDVVCLLEHVKPDLIVNAAAYTDVDSAEAHTLKAQTINGAAPGLMARWAAENTASMVHFSTDYVFDGSGNQPWFENDVPNPINIYGESKSIGDKEILSSGAPSLILRTSWVYAAHGQNFMRTMLRLGKEQSEIRVVADQIGAPTPAALLAKATADVINQAKGDLPALLRERGGVVNLAPKGETSWYGFAKAIFRSAKKRGIKLRVSHVEPIPSSEFPLPAKRPLNSRLALETAHKRYNFTIPDWHDAMESVLEEVASSK